MLSIINTTNDVCNYFIKDFSNFLEEKKMILKKVSWEYIKGVEQMITLIYMLETALSDVLPNQQIKKNKRP